MDLSEEHKSIVSQWVAAGDGLADVQRKLKEELGISMTYMDTRFLVDDLNLQLQDAEEEKVEEKNEGADESVIADKADATAALGGVNVSVDQVVRPGAIISGKVTFSDGMNASWYLDQMGRLGLDADEAGYRPSEDDLVKFQDELRKAVESGGAM